ncbi:Glutathione-dependent formaldehyde-activating enzyme [Methyloligella halotolerans]|uniref:Glutathione-dependent formaldehyde-activating enzyme n=1 Tax=Methyloligella halotolerans TaxID=1177755 RepID=A0A1E2S015_9HYPH|nr:GFA family protein [Methyloligella halotolerans]ODA67750.1 Glutathione-dependent formaldehyde-activating enzyme [Methyloligella halotolerans]
MADETESGERGNVKTGGCLCGSVRYEVRGELRPVVNCHCSQCRKTHGHFIGYTSADRNDLVLAEESGLRWYQSSEKARRGFCHQCGASLFWEPTEGSSVAISAGTLDAPTGLKTVRHIFVAEKGDYYEIDDGLPQFPGTMRGHPLPEA